MNTSVILQTIQHCFRTIPKGDPRARIAPHPFVVTLVFSFLRDKGKRSLSSLRLALGSATGTRLARSTFWERMATRRLFDQLVAVLTSLSQNLSRKCAVHSLLLSRLGIQGISLLDSTSSSLPKQAAQTFPGPRNNVAPASVKWHLFLDLLKGQMQWFQLTPAAQHDRKSFPPLDGIQGRLLIFDLGYWDYSLLKSIHQRGGYFLSRVKKNASILALKVIAGLPKKQFEGFHLFDRRLPKRKNKIVEIIGELQSHSKPLLQVRVLGFWNPVDQMYHWYVTNLKVAADLVYPLYRLRWQIELIFKAAKSSLRLADLPSHNETIIKNLILLSLVANFIAHPLSKYMSLELASEKQMAVSFQRAVAMLVHLAQYFREFILSASRKALLILIKKLKLFLPELYDPNFKHRETTLTKIWNLTENYA